MNNRQQLLLIGQLSWMMGLAFILAFIGFLIYEVFFLLSLLGFLFLYGETAPLSVRPAWRLRLRWIIVLGAGVFCAIVVRRVLIVLSEAGWAA